MHPKEGMAKCTFFASDTSFYVLWELHVGFWCWCPCSLKHLWTFRAEIQAGLSPADNPHQRARAVLTGSVDQSASLNTHTPHIAEGSPFHKEHNSLEMRTVTKNSPEKQILSENDPISFLTCISQDLEKAARLTFKSLFDICYRCPWVSGVTFRDSLFSVNILQFSFFVV